MTGPAASPNDVIDTLRAAFEPHGLFLRGIVNFSTGEAAPMLDDGQPARSIVLIGNIGGSIWPAFMQWRGDVGDGAGSDPLDTWSKAVIAPVAHLAGATAYFPSDPPWQPFQQWAMRAEGLRPSPLGILIHPQYGLSHGYRGALGFAAALPLPPARPGLHPCDLCVEKPCLSSCPANAVASAGFQVGSCRTHLRTLEGRQGCMAAGCVARAACPVGTEYRYPPEQLAFHMAALQV